MMVSLSKRIPGAVLHEISTFFAPLSLSVVPVLTELGFRGLLANRLASADEALLQTRCLLSVERWNFKE